MLVLLGTYVWTTYSRYRLKQERERCQVLNPSDEDSDRFKEWNTVQTSLQGQVLQWSRLGACILLLAFAQYANNQSRSMPDFLQCLLYVRSTFFNSVK